MAFLDFSVFLNSPVMIRSYNIICMILIIIFLFGVFAKFFLMTKAYLTFFFVNELRKKLDRYLSDNNQKNMGNSYFDLVEGALISINEEIYEVRDFYKRRKFDQIRSTLEYSFNIYYLVHFIIRDILKQIKSLHQLDPHDLTTISHHAVDINPYFRNSMILFPIHILEGLLKNLPKILLTVIFMGILILMAQNLSIYKELGGYFTLESTRAFLDGLILICQLLVFGLFLTVLMNLLNIFLDFECVEERIIKRLNESLVELWHHYSLYKNE